MPDSEERAITEERARLRKKMTEVKEKKTKIHIDYQIFSDPNYIKKAKSKK